MTNVMDRNKILFDVVQTFSTNTIEIREYVKDLKQYDYSTGYSSHFRRADKEYADNEK